MDFPDIYVLNAMLRKICSKHYVLFGWEALTIQEFIITSWDIGAKRTFWAYFGDERDWKIAEGCLATYYLAYYAEATHSWTCNNPSAAAVHTVRKCSWELPDREFGQ